MKYPSLNEQINEFPVYIFRSGLLIKTDIIKSTSDYSHYTHNLHHFVREQQYYRNPEKYKHIQKLILMPKEMHANIHSYNRNFKQKYGIELYEVLYIERSANE